MAARRASASDERVPLSVGTGCTCRMIAAAMTAVAISVGGASFLHLAWARASRWRRSGTGRRVRMGAARLFSWPRARPTRRCALLRAGLRLSVGRAWRGGLRAQPAIPRCCAGGKPAPRETPEPAPFSGRGIAAAGARDRQRRPSQRQRRSLAQHSGRWGARCRRRRACDLLRPGRRMPRSNASSAAIAAAEFALCR